MSRVRFMAILGVAALALVGVGCSSDSQDASTTSRPALVFGDGPTKSTRVGVCAAYPIADMKKVVGGGKTFRVLPPSAIGKKGDPVTGESCSWQRGEEGKDFMSLSVEARNYGKDTSTLATRMDQLQQQTVGATDVTGLGDKAFASISAANTILQVRKGGYFLTFASHADGNLKPVPLDTLKFMAGAAISKLG